MNEKRKEVIEKILNAIHSGDAVCNGKIATERQLALQIGEHRTIVREALISLEAMGVIDIRERQGIFLSTSQENEAKMLLHKVRDWPADAMSRVMEMRQILDPAIAALAATRRNNEDVQKLRNCVTTMRDLSYVDREEAHKAGAYWNTTYHTIIVAATGNTYLARMYEGVLHMIEEGMYYMRAWTQPTEYGGRSVAFDEHLMLYEAIEEGDAVKAERLAEQHLDHTIQAMVALGQIVPSSNIFTQRLAGRTRFEVAAESKI